MSLPRKYSLTLSVLFVNRDEKQSVCFLLSFQQTYIKYCDPDFVLGTGDTKNEGTHSLSGILLGPVNTTFQALYWASQVAPETWVQSLGQEDPLEKDAATHFSILAWRIPWTEEPGGPQSTDSQRVGHD